MNDPKIEVVDFGSNCRLGVCLLLLICFWFYVYLSIIFSAYYHWWIGLLVWLLSSFLKYIYIYILFPFSLFVSVYVYASLRDFCLYRLAFTICLRVLSVHFLLV